MCGVFKCCVLHVLSVLGYQKWEVFRVAKMEAYQLWAVLCCYGNHFTLPKFWPGYQKGGEGREGWQ